MMFENCNAALHIIYSNNIHLSSMLIFNPVVVNLMYVCLCIIYENDERYQLDATIY